MHQHAHAHTCEEDVEELLKLLLQCRLLPQSVLTSVFGHLLGSFNNLALQSLECTGWTQQQMLSYTCSSYFFQ